MKLWRLVCGALLLMIIIKAPAAELPVQICDDQSQWPPFLYLESQTGQYRGVVPELLEQIFSSSSVSYEISLLPWSRCLNEVENFQTLNHFEVVANASSNRSRRERYLISEPLYEISLGYFYSTDRFPQGLKVSAPSELSGLQLCGVRGFNYEPYLLESDAELDTGAPDLAAALRKVESGRCDLLLSSPVAIYGAARQKRVELPKTLRSASFSYLEPLNFHFLISKGSPRSQLILTLINEELQKMKQDGRYQQIITRYFIDAAAEK